MAAIKVMLVDDHEVVFGSLGDRRTGSSDDPRGASGRLTPKAPDAALALLLALLSEVELECRLGLAPRLLYVWRLVADSFPIVRELFEERYAEELRDPDDG